MDFLNQTVVIACHGGGVGAACAQRFLDAGARVVLLSGPGDARPQPREGLELIEVADFTDAQALTGLGEEIVRRYGRVDAAVAAVNTQPRGGFDMPEEEYQRVLHTIASGTLWFLQPMVKAMRAQQYGRVVIVMSLAGRINVRGVVPAFAAAHAALGGISRNIASTAGRDYVTCNAIAVGPLSDGSYALPDPQVGGILADRRLGRPEDVAAAAAYLAAPLSSWTTGEILDLNGGYFMI